MLRAGQTMAIVVVSLLTFGVVMVNSAGLSVGVDEPISLFSVVFSRPTIYAAIAVLMLIAGAFTPVRWLWSPRGVHSPMPWIALGMLVLLAAAHIPGIARSVNGSSRWIDFFGISFQPSEFAKWGILLLLAWHGARRATSMHRLTSGFLPAIWLVGIVSVLIAIEDLGTAVLIGVVSVCVLLTAGVRIWQACLMIPFGVGGFVAAVLHSPYRIERLMSYLDPFRDAQDSGYQIIQSMAAIAGGGLAGRGLGNGLRKFGYLPEDTTDFIFAIVCEELGIFGAAMILFLYGMFVVAGYCLIRKLTHPFHRLLATGVVLMVGLQAMINVAVVTGVAPTKGIALPLLSHGGTGWALTAFSIGLLISMERDPRMPSLHVRHGVRSSSEATRGNGSMASTTGDRAGNKPDAGDGVDDAPDIPLAPA